MKINHLLRIVAPFALGLCALLATESATAAGAAPITLTFDHLTTGFELDGVHRDLPCESCHLNAVFKGTPRTCGTCHTTGSLFNATPKTQNHIPSTNNCAACHNTISFRPDVHFDHAEVMGNCVTCHNGTISQGKDLKIHPKTSDACEACHTVVSWNPPKAVDHTEIPLAVQGFCIFCHNGVDASGKSKNHIVTTLECGDCHLTTTWKSAIFDHTGIVVGCSNCHNGVKSVGKQGSHMPTTVVCEACHTTGIGTKTPSWAPSKFDHRQMTVTTCDTCHSGTVKITTGFVSGLPANHVPLPPGHGDCSQCHGNNPSAESWASMIASIATLHSGLGSGAAGTAGFNCLMCHASQTFAGVPAPYIPMSISGISPTKKTPLAPPHIPVLANKDCGICHSGAYNAGGFGPATAMSAKTHAAVSTTCNTCHDAGRSFYVGAGIPLQLRPVDHVNSADPRMVTGDCGQCHTTTDWNSTALPTGHMPNPGKQACNVCHTAITGTAGSYKTLASVAILHTGITGSCALCHGDTSTALTWFNSYTPKDALLTPSHIPYLSGSDCSSCHAATYVTGGFGPTNMSAAKHAFVPTSCNTCHEAGLTFYLGASTPALQGRPADHLASGDAQQVSGDCSACHNTTDWKSNTLPIGHMPNPGKQACAVCHTAIGTTFASYATLASISVLHTGITGNCALCHGDTSTQLTFFNNTDNPKAAILTPAHIPYVSGTDCSSCHTANYVAGGFGPTNMSAAKHAFVPTSCDTCHEAGLTFFLGASTPPLQGRPASHLSSGDAQQATGDCSACHTPADWTSKKLPAGHMPNPGNQTCAVCHTAIGSTSASYATLASVAILHTGITGGCAQCHGNTAALTWYNNFTPKDAVLTPSHIPYLAAADCSSCHTSNYVLGGFGPTNMSAAKHAFVPTSCDTCHEAGLSFYLGASTPALQGRPADHLSSGNAQQISGDCSGCHNTTNWITTVLPPGHMPNPGNQACAVCHVGDLSTVAGYAAMGTVSALHTGITNNCSLCHGNTTTQLTFYNNNDNPKAAILTPSHIPYLTGADCASCHATNYVSGGFGPTNMSPAKHAFVPTTCDTCHDTGANFFLGASTPNVLQVRPPTHVSAPNPASQATGDCALCHNTTTWKTPTTLPNGHMPIPGTQTCSVCHTGVLTADPNSYATMSSIAILHTGITTGCAQCHGGKTPTTFYNKNDEPKSAPATHIPSFANNDCSGCHTPNYVTGGFGPMNMTQATHAAVSGSTCITCHEAGLSFFMGAASPGLQGRPANHTAGQQVAPNDCVLCHTTANWNTTVLPAGHMPNPGNQTCNVCHTAAPSNYTTLATYAVIHTGIAGNCAQCHGITPLTFYNHSADPKSAALTPSHIPFLAGTDCGTCHKTTSYAVGTFGPMNMTQATHSFVATSCVTCHEKGKSFYMGTANPALQLRPTTGSHTSGLGLTSDCSACHTTANWNTTTLPTGHMPNPGNQACAVCHIAIPTYTTLAANSVLHTGVTSGQCAQCHGFTTALTWTNNFTPKDAVLTPAHIPLLAGTDCGTCHKTTSYAVGTFGPMNMTQATHSFVATSCVTCHEKGKSFYMGTANPALQLRPTTGSHTSGQGLTGDCSGCHNTASWATTTLPTGHMPNPANQTCSVCHIAIPTYTTLAANAVLHTGVTSAQCAQCHGFTTALTWYKSYTPKDAVLAPAHIPILSVSYCGNCHAPSTYAAGAFGPMNMNSGTHTYVVSTCTTCHEAGLSFYMGAANPKLQGRPNGHSGREAAPNQCNNSGCHNTSSWNAGAQATAAAKSRSKIASVVSAPTAAASAAALARSPIGRRGFGPATLAAGPTHAGIIDNCVSCHNGALATGKGPTHVASNAACQNCHTTVAWLPARFDHQGVTAICSTCHNGVIAPGKPAKHIQTSQNCSTCHGTIAWIPVSFSHVGLNATCQTCHNGITAVGKQVQHVITIKDCSNCHNVLSWTVAPTKPLTPLLPKLRRGVAGGIAPRDMVGGSKQ